MDYTPKHAKPAAPGSSLVNSGVLARQPYVSPVPAGSFGPGPKIPAAVWADILAGRQR